MAALTFLEIGSYHETPRHFNKILVIEINGNPDLSIREKMEDHIHGDLKDLGYNAVSSCRNMVQKHSGI